MARKRAVSAAEAAGRPEHRNVSIESPTVPASAENFFAFFGIDSKSLPAVTVDMALRVPAVLAAVAFLSRTLAALPRHAYRATEKGAVKLTGKVQGIVNEAPNTEMGAFKFWQYFWQQVFTTGRGLAWIERNGNSPENIWVMNPSKVTIKRRGMRLFYTSDGIEYPASDIIDIPFMLKADQTGHHAPIHLAAKAIQLALAMNDYASGFFAGGGVPPLAMVGPLASTVDGIKRSLADVNRAIDAAKGSSRPVFPMPTGYELKPVGFDPQKGQMIGAREFQIVEIARTYQIPPVFLQDLSRLTYSNAEQQDLHLVKHLIGQWAKALDDEMSLKLFGRMSKRYVRHNLDGLQRGDFKSRIEGLARAIQTAQITPNEARALEERGEHPNPAAGELLVQGATVVLGMATTEAQIGHNGGPPLEDGENNAGQQ